MYIQTKTYIQIKEENTMENQQNLLPKHEPVGVWG